MSAKKRNIIGDRYGELTVIADAGKDKYNHFLSLVRCDCGKIYKVRDTMLIYGRTKSCGHGINKTHGMTNTRLFNIWQSMKGRCNNPRNLDYKNYGGKGVSVCISWSKDFLCFYEWAIQHGYKDNLTIDRIDVNGNYEPSNCRWATATQQARNKSNTIYVSYDGKKRSIQEVSEICGIKA